MLLFFSHAEQQQGQDTLFSGPRSMFLSKVTQLEEDAKETSSLGSGFTKG